MSGSGGTVLRQDQGLGSAALPSRGLAGLAGLELEAGLERRLKKIWTGYVEDSHRESAIALRYRQRLAGGASNPNVTKTMYHMRMLDEQASDLKN